MSNQIAQPDPDPVLDPYQLCKISRNADGTITRLSKIFPDVPANSSDDPNLQVLSKDIPLNQSKNTWLRLFIPRESLTANNIDIPSSPKLPLILYFHGGGFILLSAASSMFHDYCSNLAASIPALVASVEYGLCPENRLPGAYDDGVDALRWALTTGDDEWVRDFADRSNVFLMGDSAGGNLAYNVGLRAPPVLAAGIRGLILNQPFFGGARRTQLETRLANDRMAPLCVCDMMWELALPVGADRDHEYCNPTVESGSSETMLKGMKVMVTGWDGDPLFERQAEVAKMLEKKGVRVVAHFGVGEYHAVEVSDPSKAKLFYRVVRNFIFS